MRNITVNNIVGMPLKFRAWSVKDKTMSYHQATEIFDFIYNNHTAISQREIIITQYTGYNSKNGKDIYIGDIVYWDHIDNNLDEIVIWDTEDAVFVCDCPNGDLGSWLDTDCLIKGNIFEV